jgi:Na+/H+ antiporter NhaD/arsenite permease-like protein
MEVQQIVTLSVFAVMLILSAIRFVHPAAVALAAALGFAVWHGPTSALAGLRPDVLLTAGGVMVLAGYFKRSGLFAWLALKAARSANGRPRGILWRTGLLAYVAGALFGPGAVALVLPVALLLAVELDVPSLPFVITLSWSSLLGSIAVLTATPGNLWTASVLGIDGWHWLIRMLPFSLAALIVTLAISMVAFRRSLRVTNERRARVLEYDESKALEDKTLTAKTATVLILVIIGLALQPVLQIEPDVIVLGGALLLALLAGRQSLPAALGEIDGAGLLWYGAALSVFGAVAASGVWSIGSWHLPPMAILWGSAAAGTVLDPGTIAGSLAAALPAQQTSLWPLVVAGASMGGGAAFWSFRTAALKTAVSSNRGPGWMRFTLWGLLFAAVGLLVISGLWLLLP